MAKQDVDLSEFLKYRKGSNERIACKVVEARKKIKSSVEEEQFNAAIDQPKELISGAAVEEWCKSRNIKITSASVSRHRNKICKCYENE